MDRRKFLTGVGTAGGIALAGCTGGPTDGGDGGSTPTSTPEPTETEGPDSGGETETETQSPTPSDPINVGMVYATGGLGDGSFNDQAQQGIQQAEEDFGISYGEAQPSAVSEFANFQQQFARSTDPTYELICCIGFLQASALSENAPDFLDQEFMIVDSVVEADNVASYVFAEHEGSYLVGQLAGLLTTRDFSAGAGSTTGDSTNVGFVGGVESPLIRRFQAGYEAGVKAADEDVDIQTSYVGDFNAPTAGKEAALAMYDSGADIVYHAAGNTGTGVFQAAQEQGKFAVGVDRDQSVTKDSYANVILASMVKRVDTAVYNAVEAVVNDEFEGGTTTALGLDDDGVGIVYGQQLGSSIPSGVKDAISGSRQSIIDGDISVPTDPGNV
ncbi:BMP family ABC transporter substrate-binding protein [Halobacteriales archaeon QS_5_70_15]|nr:MAG: BMP family ABC transporter substrate-binding protein [Halobacteriales archaeon QS_5_70_15]